MKLEKSIAEDLRRSILHDNHMLYCMHARPAMETAMCFGLDCGDGWLDAIDTMSKALEALNYEFYPRFRVRVQMDQVKEKFGSLTCYYSIVCDPPSWMCGWRKAFQFIFDQIDKIDFAKVEVIDRDAYDAVEEEEITREEYLEEVNKCVPRAINVKFYEKDGKLFKKTTYEHAKQTRVVPSRFKLLFKLLNARHAIESFPFRAFNFNPSHKQLCIKELLAGIVPHIVAKAKKECDSVCINCGTPISGEDGAFSPRCTMQGYILYMCKDCAVASKYTYEMQGAIYKENDLVISREDFAKGKTSHAVSSKKFPCKVANRGNHR